MRRQRRFAIILSMLFGLDLLLRVGARAASYCGKYRLCADLPEGLFHDDNYVGHDEPSLLFYSNTPGSGNSSFYIVTCPWTCPWNPLLLRVAAG